MIILNDFKGKHYNLKHPGYYFWRYLTRRLIWHLSQSSIRPSILVWLLNHARIRSWNQPVLSNQGNILAKEIMGAFDGAQTHDLHIMSQTCNPLQHAAPYMYRVLSYWDQNNSCKFRNHLKQLSRTVVWLWSNKKQNTRWTPIVVCGF